MKVSELITKLQSFPSNADIICYQEENDNNQLFEIEDICIHQATKNRTVKNKPILTFEESKNSEEHVIISIVSDF